MFNESLTLSTLSNFNRLSHSLFWNELKRSVGLKGLRNNNIKGSTCIVIVIYMYVKRSIILTCDKIHVIEILSVFIVIIIYEDFILSSICKSNLLSVLLCDKSRSSKWESILSNNTYHIDTYNKCRFQIKLQGSRAFRYRTLVTNVFPMHV